MITIILDGLVLLGLMYLFDRQNPNRDFLETGLVAFLLVIAALLMNKLVTPTLGLFALLPYFGLCVLLLWKLPKVPIRRAVVIAIGFIAFKVVEPYVLRALSVADALTYLFVVAAATLTAQGPWHPSPGHQQVSLWPGAVPNAQPATGPEEATLTLSDHYVAGKPWTYVRNVSQPTLTVYSPAGDNTGAAVVVFPGGGYQILAIDLEGTEVCDWLTSKGITCVLLKYRVPKTGPSWQPDCRCLINPKPAPALQDAQRAIGLVRLHAAEWHIDPHKIGVLGFSAGGHLAAAISNSFQERLYPPVDAADKESCRPDFAVAVYPGHLWMPGGGQYAFNPDIHVTRNTPPTFLLQAETDSVDNVNQALVYYVALKDAGVPAEMHLYTDGGHAFGLRRTKDPITAWPELVERWLETIGMTPRRNQQ